MKRQRVPDRRAKMREGTIAFHFVLIGQMHDDLNPILYLTVICLIALQLSSVTMHHYLI